MVSTVTELRKTCTITDWDGDPRKCQVCNTEITDKRRTVFCSKKCSLWWERNHIWRKARVFARRKGKYACIICQAHKSETSIEVDHKNPINGVNYNIPSCIHHQDNLQLLCKKHHILKTSAEASARAKRNRTT